MRVRVGGYPTYGPPGSPEAAAVVSLLAESPLVAGLEVPWEAAGSAGHLDALGLAPRRHVDARDDVRGLGPYMGAGVR
ncbi:MAG: hypothetical protein ACYC1E_03475 [Propionibacteriaceae bacterium]